VTLTVTVADPDVLEALAGDALPDGVRLVLWDMERPASDVVTPEDVDVVVVPHYRATPPVLRRLAEVPRLRVVQLPSAGYEHALPFVPPGVVVCNGRTVHDSGTAELAVALALAAQRGIGDAVRDMADAVWRPQARASLADRRVMVLGYGSIGSAVGRRLEAFEAEVVPVARTPREAPEGHVHGVDELAELLPGIEILVIVLPLDDGTEGLLDARLLSLLPDGALVVNVGRGKVVDTPALVAELESGRLRAALDVTDPEPLPADHPLWRTPNTIITPHIGGMSDATTPRLVALMRRQLDALAAGRDPENVVRR
jgi:phosphoglycerate dehydrogenase-like enzyme